MATKSQVAFVTGGASGMGLAVVEDLVKQGWNVTIFDFDQTAGNNLAERLGDNVLFIQGNVVKYEELGAAFTQTWKRWGSVDFVFANAGIGERTKFYDQQEELAEGFPSKPNTLTMEVNLFGVVYTAYLALHFFRKHESKSGKLVMTSSASALYPAPSLALYASAKHAVVGLTRSMGTALKKEPITVNCICPGLVPTGLLPPAFTDGIQQDMLTPTSTVVKAIHGFLSDGSITAQVAECSGQDVIYRPSFEPENEAAKYMLSLQDGTVAAKIDFAGLGKHIVRQQEIYKGMEVPGR